MAKLIKTTELLKKFSKFGTKIQRWLLFILERKPKSNSTGEFHIDLHGSGNNLFRLALGHIKLI